MKSTKDLFAEFLLEFGIVFAILYFLFSLVEMGVR